MWLSQIWTTQWLIIHLIPSYFRCKICKLFHFYILFTYSLIAGKIKCNVSGKIFHDSGDTAMSNSRKFWVYHCFRWVCYETAAHQPETPNLYTLTPMIVMKEKIKPNQEDDFHIEKMRQKSTSFLYISNPEPMTISYGNIRTIVSS